MARHLNSRQLRFVTEYLRGVGAGTPNATAAYQRVFGCRSRDAARSAAARLLKDARVKELLHPVAEAAEVARVEQVRGIEITRERIRLEMARLAFVNPKNLFREDGRLKTMNELDADTAAALAQFEVREETDDDGTRTCVTRIRLWDKNKALVSLADTEPGVWVEDGKPAGSQVNVSVTNTIGRNTLTPEDLLEVERILAQCTVVDRIEIYDDAFQKAAARELPEPKSQPPHEGVDP